MALRKIATAIMSFATISLVACGGGSSTRTTPPPTTAQAQGVYQGSTSTGGQFVGIVEPNDNLYAVYVSGTSAQLSGMIAGTATENSSSFTAPIHDFYADGTVNSGTLAGSFVANTSLSGTLTETNASITLTGQVIPSTEYNYATTPHLADIAGSYSGQLLDGESADITVSATGVLSGTSSGGCAFTGTAAVDASGKNFFDVNLTFGASPCLAPNVSLSGVAIVVPPSTGSSSSQVLAALKASDNSLGTVYLGSTSTTGSPGRLQLFR